MRRFASVIRLALVMLVAVLVSTPPVLAAGDPRATIVVLGDMNSLPHQMGPDWPTLVQRQHPDWNVQNLSDAKRLLPQLVETIDDLLAPLPHVEVVVIFTGTADAAAKEYAQTPAPKLGEAMSALLGKLKANPKSKGAQIVLLTPMPIVDARLDKWSTDRFKDGQANSAAIAQAFKDAAAKTGVAVNDFQAWALSQESDGKPGMLVGSIGWIMRDWGHPIAARYMDELLTKLNPAAPDPAALEQWRRARAAEAQLNQILHDTGAGTVDHSPKVFDVTPGAKGALSVAVPVDLLTGPTLDIVVRATAGKLAVLGGSANLTGYQTRLEAVTPEGKVAIKLMAQHLRTIDSTRPDQIIAADRYRFNAGKMNYFSVASGEPGKERWIVARFDLSALKGKKPTEAAIVIGMPSAPQMQVFTPPDKNESLGGEFDKPLISAIVGRDAQWDPASATWKSRDGRMGWTGGTPDLAKRKAAIQAFLATNPPAEVAAMAKALLAKPGT